MTCGRPGCSAASISATPLTASEFSNVRLFHSAFAQSGGGKTTEDLNLVGLPGMDKRAKLSGKRKLNTMLRDPDNLGFTPSDLKFYSSPMEKIEAGILSRRLWPLDWLSQAFVEPFKMASKELLRVSAYSQLQKEVGHAVAQRISRVEHARTKRPSGSSLLNR